jgi:hypothetical protein
VRVGAGVGSGGRRRCRLRGRGRGRALTRWSRWRRPTRVSVADPIGEVRSPENEPPT